MNDQRESDRQTKKAGCGDTGRAVKKLRDTYNLIPGAPLVQREFGFYSLEKWKQQGMPEEVPLAELFGFDPPSNHQLGGLGWCEAAFFPPFTEKIVEDRGQHEVIRDVAGRHVLVFKGRRSGFMPEYLDHPVKDEKTWYENVKWRLDPSTPERYSGLEDEMNYARRCENRGMMITQRIIGGYMYLRSLIGPENLLYKFYDEPELIHDCMQTWLALADGVTSRHQKHVTLDEVFIAEDICYKQGPLISPLMIEKFLFPYYRQFLDNIRSRQMDKDRHLYFQVDTDGYAEPVILLYSELGMDVMSPFEVAAGCNVVEIGRAYPNLIITGGIDKRELARGRSAIDRHVDSIIPVMKERGGYIPTCDHGVPQEVNYRDYLHFRKRCLEFG